MLAIWHEIRRRNFQYLYNAIEKLERLEEDVSRIGAKLIWPNIVSLTAQIFWFSGDNKRAIELLEGAVAQLEYLGSSLQLASEYTNLANLYAESGRVQDNLLTTAKAIVISRENPQSDISAALYSNLSESFYEIGDHRLSLITGQRPRNLIRDSV